MSLIHCIYASTAVGADDPLDPPALLEAGRRHNARHAITGLLLAVEGDFIHVLEGEADAVDELFLHIANDPRHLAVTEIVREPIVRRHFAAWHLGFVAVERVAVEQTPGLDGLFSDIGQLQDIDPGRAITLLAAFADRA